MPNQVPSFDDQSIADVAFNLYGVEGKITQLVSFEDQNARIKTANGSYVLKMANKRILKAALDMQTDVLAHLKATAPDIAVPEVVKTKDGNTVTNINGYNVRMLTYLEGDILTNATRTPALNHDIGSFMGRYARAMQGYEHPAAHVGGDLWNLDNVIDCKEHLGDVAVEHRPLLARYYDIYERETLPKLPTLRKAVLHNDANEQNLLVTTTEPVRISGVIDFGEMQYATQVNEIAVTTAYSLLDEDDVQMTAHEIIAGYREEFELEAIELEILPNLIAMRLVQSITLSSHRAKEFPDNDYITISQKPALSLLKQLDAAPLSFKA